MSKDIKCYDEMLKHQMKGVFDRKTVIERILRDLDCDSYSSFTALTNAVADRYTKQKGEPMSGSTLRRNDSKYRLLVESYYNTEARMKKQSQNKESQLQEQLMISELQLSQATADLNATRKALQNANSEIDRLKLSDIQSRTDGGLIQEYSDKEVAAYKVLVELVKACDEAGLELDGYQITTLGLQGVKTLINQEKCPSFFKWYREQLKG
ncbi:TPA: hypothetical protein NGS68_003311 [Vibrio parahaemolyticus]|uniref:hypothetical protein n=1 Tax=Vibrio sp. EA2 TaxID=3079860 RepID=UPI0018A47D88|nr:hypothetical protein [Vibrio sp. EA2]MDV6253063.1 hypothetical protein [Vibrio sp. EA2]QOW04636.1 hypothetical protein IC830_11315 [Vibrio parahaemolyticus]HCE1979999.1 hypothetical protein [Vibrio parahaemolyticus]HCG6658795.1 hypothetical protein [Vibrio parahaemolyticus]